jgi:hypothetical protein
MRTGRKVILLQPLSKSRNGNKEPTILIKPQTKKGQHKNAAPF